MSGKLLDWLNNMETLFISKHPWLDEIYLKDANGFKIGRFNSVDEAKQWCESNGYKYRIA
jgi:hypothetical protein